MIFHDVHRFSLTFPLKCHFIFTRYSPDATSESSPLWFTVVTFGWWWSWLNPHDALRIPQRIRGSRGCRQGTSTASVSNHLLHSCCKLEGNVKATWRQREGNVKATWIKWKHPIESSLQDPIKINSRTFKLFQQCWCLVFVLFLLTAATSVLQKQPWRSGMGQNWCANSLDKFVYVQRQKASNHPFVGMFTQYIEIRSIIFMLEVKIHKFHTHVLIHMFPCFSWIIKKKTRTLLLSFQDSQVIQRSILSGKLT